MEFKSFCSQLFGKLFVYNTAWMKKSEDLTQEGQYTCNDIFDFYITSNAQSLLLSLWRDLPVSAGICFNARCILEGLALKRLCAEKDFPLFQKKLLQFQYAVLEKHCYKKFEDISEMIQPPDDEEQRRTIGKFTQIIRDNLGEGTVNDILKSNIPFLCDPEVTYHGIIRQELGSDASVLYALFSQQIHPSAYEKIPESVSKILNEGIGNVLALIEKEYSTLPDRQETLVDRWNLVMSADVAREYNSIIQEETRILYGVKDVFDRTFGEDCYVSHVIRTLSLLLIEQTGDKLFGLCEQVKAKWKTLLELFSSFRYEYNKGIAKGYYALMREHFRVKLLSNMELECSSEKAYAIYSELYPQGCSKDKFDRLFRKTTGYTINETGRLTSLTQMVSDYIAVFENNKASLDWKEVMRLDYVESQMMSHANGYMWFANSGAWRDIDNIIRGTDLGILQMLERIKVVFLTQRDIEKDNRYRRVINVTRNSIKKVKILAERKNEILLYAPQINL